MPKNRVLSGTIADREGFVPGNSYMVSIQELPSNEYGEQYRFSNLGSILNSIWFRNIFLSLLNEL